MLKAEKCKGRMKRINQDMLGHGIQTLFLSPTRLSRILNDTIQEFKDHSRY